MFKDLKTLTIKKLVDHLQAAEERFKPLVEKATEKARKLLLMEYQKLNSPQGSSFSFAVSVIVVPHLLQHL
jgi:hypothetical protein